MKKFLKVKLGRGKKSNASDTTSIGSAAGASSITVGYDLREKDLPKLHKAAWNGDLSKVKQLAKKDASPLDKENRYALYSGVLFDYFFVGPVSSTSSGNLYRPN
jgi:hypothetical protein